MTLTGVQMVTGTEIREPGLFGGGTSRRISGEPLAAAVLACALVGLVVAFAGGRMASLGSTVVAVAGAALLLVLKNKVEGEALREGGGMLEVGWKSGFWLALVCFAVAGLLGLFTQRLRGSSQENPL